MADKKNSKIEREYIIPLREKCRPVPRYKKTPKAIKSLKEFVAKHMQIRDRDLKKIKVDSYLNELIWERGIKKPLHKVKVKVVKEGDIVRVYAAELSTNLKFKKERLEKREVKATEQKEEQKSMMEKAKEQMQGKAPEAGSKDTKEEVKKEEKKVETKKEEKKEEVEPEKKEKDSKDEKKKDKKE